MHYSKQENRYIIDWSKAIDIVNKLMINQFCIHWNFKTASEMETTTFIQVHSEVSIHHENRYS